MSITTTINVTSNWTEIFDKEIFGFYVLYIEEQEDVECSGAIEFIEHGSLISGNNFQNVNNRGITNISLYLPCSYKFPDSPNRVYEIRKTSNNHLEVRTLSGSDILVKFTIFFGGIAGATGPSGIVGATGPSGVEGIVGPTGPSGNLGLQGLKGESELNLFFTNNNGNPFTSFTSTTFTNVSIVYFSGTTIYGTNPTQFTVIARTNTNAGSFKVRIYDLTNNVVLSTITVSGTATNTIGYYTSTIFNNVSSTPALWSLEISGKQTGSNNNSTDLYSAYIRFT